jgi:taurine dioxygenase
MTGITIRNLRDDLSFGAIVEGIDWNTLADEGVRRARHDRVQGG